jgi:uncharacterized protein
VRVNVVDLVGHPGATRAVHDVVALDEFGDDPWGTAEGLVRDPVTLDLHLDSVVEGILVRGTVIFELVMPCARCLVDQQHRVEASVTELFMDPARIEPDDDELDPGYELVDDLTGLDLSALVRDALLIDLPIRVLCRDDCAGLCPTCGVDRNREDCGHRDAATVDPRWAALSELRLPPG